MSLTEAINPNDHALQPQRVAVYICGISSCCILFKVYKTTILHKRVLKPGLDSLSLSPFAMKQLILLKMENTD